MRRGNSQELEGTPEVPTMEPWDSFDIEAGPIAQDLMRGSSPLGQVIAGAEVPSDLDGQWRRGIGRGPVPGYSLQRRGAMYRYKRNRKAQKQIRRARRQYASPGAAPPPWTPTPAPAPALPDASTPPLPETPAALDPNLAALLAFRQGQGGEVPEDTDSQESEEAVEGIASELLFGEGGTPAFGRPSAPFGASSALQGYQRPGPPPPAYPPQGGYGQSVPQGYGQPAPQGYGQPAPQGGGYGVKGEPHSRPRLPGVHRAGASRDGGGRGRAEAGYWTSLDVPGEGTKLATPEWTEIGTIGEAVERIRAVVRDFRALPVPGQQVETQVGVTDFRTLLYRAVGGGTMQRNRAFDLAKEYGKQWGEAYGLLTFIDEIQDDESLINRVASQVRDRVNDCRNLVRQATGR